MVVVGLFSRAATLEDFRRTLGLVSKSGVPFLEGVAERDLDELTEGDGFLNIPFGEKTLRIDSGNIFEERIDDERSE